MKLTNLTARESTMSNVYIEPRLCCRGPADHLLVTFKTQREAIEWARTATHRWSLAFAI
jgi:hypothetical protein